MNSTVPWWLFLLYGVLLSSCVNGGSTINSWVSGSFHTRQKKRRQFYRPFWSLYRGGYQEEELPPPPPHVKDAPRVYDEQKAPPRPPPPLVRRTNNNLSPKARLDGTTSHAMQPPPPGNWRRDPVQNNYINRIPPPPLRGNQQQQQVGLNAASNAIPKPPPDLIRTPDIKVPQPPARKGLFQKATREESGIVQTGETETLEPPPRIQLPPPIPPPPPRKNIVMQTATSSFSRKNEPIKTQGKQSIGATKPEERATASPQQEQQNQQAIDTSPKTESDVLAMYESFMMEENGQATANEEEEKTSFIPNDKEIQRPKDKVPLNSDVTEEDSVLAVYESSLTKGIEKDQVENDKKEEDAYERNDDDKIALSEALGQAAARLDRMGHALSGALVQATARLRHALSDALLPPRFMDKHVRQRHDIVVFDPREKEKDSMRATYDALMAYRHDAEVMQDKEAHTDPDVLSEEEEEANVVEAHGDLVRSLKESEKEGHGTHLVVGLDSATTGTVELPPRRREPVLVRRRVIRTQKVPRRTILSSMTDFHRDLTNDEMDLLIKDLSKPSIVEEEYSTYEYDEELYDDIAAVEEHNDSDGTLESLAVSEDEYDSKEDYGTGSEKEEYDFNPFLVEEQEEVDNLYDGREYDNESEYEMESEEYENDLDDVDVYALESGEGSEEYLTDAEVASVQAESAFQTSDKLISEIDEKVLDDNGRDSEPIESVECEEMQSSEMEEDNDQTNLGDTLGSVPCPPRLDNDEPILDEEDDLDSEQGEGAEREEMLSAEMEEGIDQTNLGDTLGSVPPPPRRDPKGSVKYSHGVKGQAALTSTSSGEESGPKYHKNVPSQLADIHSNRNELSDQDYVALSIWPRVVNNGVGKDLTREAPECNVESAAQPPPPAMVRERLPPLPPQDQISNKQRPPPPPPMREPTRLSAENAYATKAQATPLKETVPPSTDKFAAKRRAVPPLAEPVRPSAATVWKEESHVQGRGTTMHSAAAHGVFDEPDMPPPPPERESTTFGNPPTSSTVSSAAVKPIRTSTGRAHSSAVHGVFDEPDMPPPPPQRDSTTFGNPRSSTVSSAGVKPIRTSTGRAHAVSNKDGMGIALKKSATSSSATAKTRSIPPPPPQLPLVTDKTQIDLEEEENISDVAPAIDSSESEGSEEINEDELKLLAETGFFDPQEELDLDTYDDEYEEADSMDEDDWKILQLSRWSPSVDGKDDRDAVDGIEVDDFTYDQDSDDLNNASSDYFTDIGEDEFATIVPVAAQDDEYDIPPSSSEGEEELMFLGDSAVSHLPDPFAATTAGPIPQAPHGTTMDYYPGIYQANEEPMMNPFQASLPLQDTVVFGLPQQQPPAQPTTPTYETTQRQGWTSPASQQQEYYPPAHQFGMHPQRRTPEQERFEQPMLDQQHRHAGQPPLPPKQ